MDKLTKDAFDERLKKETIRIPKDEMARISEAYLGYTTWEEVKKKIPSIVFMTQKAIKMAKNKN